MQLHFDTMILSVGFRWLSRNQLSQHKFTSGSHTQITLIYHTGEVILIYYTGFSIKKIIFHIQKQDLSFSTGFCLRVFEIIGVY